MAKGASDNMASKSSKRRRARKQAAQSHVAVHATANDAKATHAPDQATDNRKATRPTGERMARGRWRLPQGMGKHDQPVIDTSADIIGQMHDAGQISNGQEQAARHWQALRAAYIAEFPDVSGFKSCLAGNVPGFDDGDGDEQVIREYRNLEARLSRTQRIEVLHVCEDGYRPRDIAILRGALNVVRMY